MKRYSVHVSMKSTFILSLQFYNGNEAIKYSEVSTVPFYRCLMMCTSSGEEQCSQYYLSSLNA